MSLKNKNWNCWRGLLVAAAASILCGSAMPQQLPRKAMHSSGTGNYDVARESVLEGKVLKVTNASTSTPLGARVSLQSASGVIDVHGGNSKLLENSGLSLQAGDSVSITGENVTFGTSTVFIARLIRKGGQSVAVRSTNGMPLLPSARNASGKIVTPAGAR
jgi:DNA/RNA endonuclease YhcR with UshA esterase domain